MREYTFLVGRKVIPGSFFPVAVAVACMGFLFVCLLVYFWLTMRTTWVFFPSLGFFTYQMFSAFPVLWLRITGFCLPGTYICQPLFNVSQLSSLAQTQTEDSRRFHSPHFFLSPRLPVRPLSFLIKVPKSFLFSQPLPTQNCTAQSLLRELCLCLKNAC